MKLSGVVTPIGTPLTDSDRVDEAGLRRLNRYLLNGGVHALLANGSMGGFAFLTDDEQVRSVGITVSEVNHAIPVIGGIGETSTNRAVRMAKRLVAEGVDYLSLLPPFYFLATQEHLIAYFSEIASAVDIPIFLYDNPVLTKNPIHPQTVALLNRQIPHLIGIKVSNQDCLNMQELLGLTKYDLGFSVLTGSEFLIPLHLRMGCDGFVGGLHNLCPHMAVALYNAFKAGDQKRADELQVDLAATWQLFRRGSIWGAFDEALRYLSICDRATGSPYVTSMTEQDRREVREIVERQIVKPYLAAGVLR
jgi:4-hydroxy-tetrahydrodipicolinate synthase